MRKWRRTMFNSDKCECNASCYHECMCDWVVKKEWISLSDDEINLIYPCTGGEYDFKDIARAIEAKLKEKNG